MKTCKFFILILLTIFLSIAATAMAGPSKDKAHEVEDAFNQESRNVRSDHLLLPMNYIEVDGISYGYYLPRRFVRMAKSGETFRIRKIKTSENMLKVEIESKRKIRQKIVLFDDEYEVTSTLLDVVFPKMLAQVFNYGTTIDYPRVVANSRSNMAHLGMCNHLPADSLRIVFADTASVLAAGHRLCPACFPPDPPLPYANYMTIRIAALEKARLYERAFPLVEDQQVQEHLQTLGESLLAGLPFVDKGFNYRFRAVQSEVMQSIAMPTGFVYITDKLLDSVEDELELAHVLAHEIVHCELHLPPNTYNQLPDLLNEVNGFYSSKMIMDHYYKKMRQAESASDLVALSVLAKLYPDGNAAAAANAIMRKLQFANEATPLMEVDSDATHPSYGMRLDVIKNGFFPVNTDEYFEALDDDGEWGCRVRILGGGFRGKKDEIVHLLVEMSDGADMKLEISNVYNRAGGMNNLAGKNYNLLFIDETELVSGEMEIITLEISGVDRNDFGCSTEENPKILDLTKLEMVKLSNLQGADKWVKRYGVWE